MNKSLLIILTFLFFTLPLASAANDFAYNRLYDGTQLIDGLNYSINVNHSSTSDLADNSLLFDDYSVAGLYTYYKGLLNNVGEILHSNLGNLLWSQSGHTIDTTLDMNGNNIDNANNINATGNITAGENVIVSNNLYVGLTPEETRAIGPGSAVFAAAVTGNDTIISYPKQYSTGLVAFNNGDNAPGETEVYVTGAGFVSSSGRTFCDTTNSPFVLTDIGKIFTIVLSSEFGSSSIPFEITDLINSSCVDISFAIFEDSEIVDINVIVYALVPEPVLATFDNGFVLSNIGTGEDSSFKVNALNATGIGKFQINTKSNSNGVNAMRISSDQNGHYGLSNFESYVYSTVDGDNILITNSIMSANLVNQTNGEYTGTRYALINPGENVTSTAIEVSSNHDNILLIQAERELSSAIYDNTTGYENITIDINNQEVSTQLFTEEDGTLYIGDGGNFTKMFVNLLEGGSSSIQPEFYYCNDVGSYSIMNVSDTTGGFTSPGNIIFNNPLDRGVCNTTIEGDPLPDSNKFTYIAIRRKASVISMPPYVLEINVLSDSSRIIFGNDGFVDSETAFGFSNEEFQEEGSIVFYFESKNVDGEPLTNLVMQSGRNESVGIFGNSLFLAPNFWGKDNFSTDEGKVNLTELTNYINLCSVFGPLYNVTCQFSADSREEGTMIGVFNAEIWKQLRVHGGARIDTDLDVVLSNGNELDIIGGGIHPSQTRLEEVGFAPGDDVRVLNANFDEGVLFPFNVTTTGGTLDWSISTSILCHSDFCARALGDPGSAPRIMKANFSTSDINDLHLTFWFTSALNGDSFTLDVNNNIGSGDVNVYTTTINNADVFVNVTLPASMDNQSVVTLTATLVANNQIQDFIYLDEVFVDGNATANTLQNVTRTDSLITFSEGNINPGTGLPFYGIYFNDSSKITQFLGNVTFSEQEVVQINVTDNVTANNFIARENYYYENGDKINDTFFRVDGTSQMQGNTDQGGYNITNAGTITSYGRTVLTYELNQTGTNSTLKWIKN